MKKILLGLVLVGSFDVSVAMRLDESRKSGEESAQFHVAGITQFDEERMDEFSDASDCEVEILDEGVVYPINKVQLPNTGEIQRVIGLQKYHDDNEMLRCSGYLGDEEMEYHSESDITDEGVSHCNDSEMLRCSGYLGDEETEYYSSSDDEDAEYYNRMEREVTDFLADLLRWKHNHESTVEDAQSSYVDSNTTTTSDNEMGE